ncbi:MAG: hypothetical protein RQ826_04735 [Xanthomonadales bacterium]|nr:hypothetical protein [Xanthomonadales bacterium]
MAGIRLEVPEGACQLRGRFEIDRISSFRPVDRDHADDLMFFDLYVHDDLLRRAGSSNLCNLSVGVAEAAPTNGRC